MMGNRQRGTYLSINADGKFAKKVDAQTVGAKSRVNKKGDTVHEIYFDFVKGQIKSVKSKPSPFGRQWEIVMTSGEKKVIINLSYTSNYAKAFLKMLPNIDLSQNVELVPSSKLEDGQNKTSLFIYQNKELVKYAFTKDNANGMPERKLTKVNGEDKYDYTDQLEWLEKKATEKLGDTSADEETEDVELDEDGQPVVKAKTLDDFVDKQEAPGTTVAKKKDDF